MDGIVTIPGNQQPGDKSAKDQEEKSAIVDEQPHKEQGPSYGTRGKNVLQAIQKKKDAIFGSVPLQVRAMDQSPSDNHQCQFAIDDRVIIQTAKDVPIHGVVRWTGPIKLSKQSGVPTVIAVGVETVSMCNM